MKHQIVHTLQKYLPNPPIKLTLRRGLLRAYRKGYEIQFSNDA